MPNKYISIQEAAELCNKSLQTIRRAIKAKKLTFRKQKTPQGFNYLLEKASLQGLYKIPVEKSPRKIATKSETVQITTDDFKSFTRLMEKMISQHSDERQNFLRLVDGLQEKIFTLENQLNLLKTPAKKWYQVWR